MEKHKVYFEASGSYTARKTFEIEAATREEAVKKAQEMYDNDEINSEDARRDFECGDYSFY